MSRGGELCQQYDGVGVVVVDLVVSIVGWWWGDGVVVVDVVLG